MGYMLFVSCKSNKNASNLYFVYLNNQNHGNTESAFNMWQLFFVEYFFQQFVLFNVNVPNYLLIQNNHKC